MESKSIQVYNNDILVGVLKELPNGQYSFRYDHEYYNNPELPQISVTLPKAQQEYVSEVLLPFFNNMLPEGTNRKVICQRVNLQENNYFGMLLSIRGADFIGAINLR